MTVSQHPGKLKLTGKQKKTPGLEDTLEPDPEAEKEVSL